MTLESVENMINMLLHMQQLDNLLLHTLFSEHCLLTLADDSRIMDVATRVVFYFISSALVQMLI